MKHVKSFLTFLLLASALCAVPVKMTYAQAKGLLYGLTNLDGYQSTDVDNKAIVKAYDLAGPTRLKVYKDLIAVRAALTPYDQTSAKILTASGIIDPKKATAEQTKQANDEWASATKDPLTIDLQTFAIEDFKTDTNPIPGTVLEGLAVAISK